MKILALELSSALGSIAFFEAETEVFAVEFANNRRDSGLFFEALQRCRESCGDSDRIVVGLGPGSYAGTRIAIGAAIGLGAATGAQLRGLPSFCAMPTSDAEFTVIGDARRKSFYYARVAGRRCVEGPVLLAEAEVQAQLATASQVFATEPLPSFPQAVIAFPSAAILARLARAEHEDMVHEPLEPIYLREPHITWPRVAAERIGSG